MIKHSLGFVFGLLVSMGCLGQEKGGVTPTDYVVVTGDVEKEITLHAAQLSAMPAITLGDVAITNHAGEPRGTAKGLKGVRLTDALSGLQIKSESPKALSEFYFILIASDGYTVVFSWNELFNSPTGNSCYLITEKEGKGLEEMSDRILALTPSDLRTGRRHVKGLQQIVVSRAKTPAK